MLVNGREDNNRTIQMLLSRVADLEARLLRSGISSSRGGKSNTLMDSYSSIPVAPSLQNQQNLSTSQIKQLISDAARTAEWELITGPSKPDDSATLNNIFMQDDEPEHDICQDGDLWFDTNDNNHLYRFDISTDAFVTARDGMILSFGDDGIITPLEKLDAKREWDTIVAEGNASTGLLVVKAISLGKDHASFDSAYSALDTYLNTTLAVFSDMDSNTSVTRSTWDGKWKDYYDARTSLANSFIGTVGAQDTVDTDLIETDAISEDFYASKSTQSLPDVGTWYTALSISIPDIKAGDRIIVQAKAGRSAPDMTMNISFEEDASIDSSQCYYIDNTCYAQITIIAQADSTTEVVYLKMKQDYSASRYAYKINMIVRRVRR